MKFLFTVRCLVALLFVSLCFGTEARGEPAPHYRIRLTLHPDEQELEAEVWVRSAASPLFYLHGGLHIQEARTGDTMVSFRPDTSAGALDYSVGIPYRLDSIGSGTVYLRYSGAIRDVVHQVNMISPDHVELAYYAAWYPIFTGMPGYTYDLEIDVPSGFVTTTNGRLSGTTERDGRTITTWSSFGPSYDIALVSGPGLSTLALETGQLQVEMLYGRLSPEYMQSKMKRLSEDLDLLTASFGKPYVQGVPRFVYAPRAGWGYSRIPLIIVSEDYVRSQIEQPWGDARNDHGSSHELAHFWWSIANASTTDDWINEGLAEFSAFRLSESRQGKAFADTLIQEYRRHAAESQTDASIAETETSSPDRYVNRYEKTTLMLIELQNRAGRERLDAFLTSIHTRYRSGGTLTTTTFLGEAASFFGPEVHAFLHESLHRRGKASGGS